MSKKVYIAYTGGTIGMQQVNGRYLPIPNFLQQLMADNPAFHHPELPQFRLWMRRILSILPLGSVYFAYSSFSLPNASNS